MQVRSTRPRLYRWVLATSVAAALLSLGPIRPARAQPAEAPRVNSAMDAPLLNQLLVAEMALNGGDAGSAYQLILDAARRSRDEGLFRRAADIALQARAGDQALAATQAWRQASPDSLDAIRMQMQIQLMLNKPDGLGESMQALLALTAEADRPGLITALPRLMQRAVDPKSVASVLDNTLKPYRQPSATQVPARVATGRAWLEAHEPDRALDLAREAHGLEPAAPGPVLLALELMRERPAAEALVLDYLGQRTADPALRLAYVRLLTTGQRYEDAVRQLQTVSKQQPDLAPVFLSLGALQLELKHPKEGEEALLRYIELVQSQSTGAVTMTASTPVALPEPADGDDDEDTPARPEQGLVQAWLMLSQAAEQRGDIAAAERWLNKIEDPQRALEVQSRRAAMLVRQGKLEQARELIRKVPERRADDARAKLVAEAGLLRDARQWREAFDVLADASSRFNDDPDLMYEQAMMAEKIERMDEMERLLRRVIELKPENAHAHNALGYSLADRSQRLPEARELIKRALELSPGDPFITDSLGWVEYRMNNRDEALRLLQGAYSARPDVEIAAHLGEVLWQMGQRDEARRVFNDAKGRDSANDVLQEVLSRLHVEP
jgi:tetratricopeptide (TPR) repeat protein